MNKLTFRVQKLSNHSHLHIPESSEGSFGQNFLPQSLWIDAHTACTLLPRLWKAGCTMQNFALDVWKGGYTAQNFAANVWKAGSAAYSYRPGVWNAGAA